MRGKSGPVDGDFVNPDKLGHKMRSYRDRETEKRERTRKTVMLHNSEGVDRHRATGTEKLDQLSCNSRQSDKHTNSWYMDGKKGKRDSE